MDSDLRESSLYREAESIYETVYQPGTGRIGDAAEVDASPDGRHAVFSGVIIDSLEGAPPTRICEVDLTTGTTRVLTFGPHTDRLPKYSPDGRKIAFLSDRQQAGDFQLYLLDLITGGARLSPRVEGWVEYLHWSTDGKRILLGVAGHGADVAGAQGAVTSKRSGEHVPSWMPAVDGGEEGYSWRRVWLYDLATDTVRQVSPAESNVWEAVWCGDAAFAAVVSPGPKESLWYSARLHIVSVDTGAHRESYVPQDQLGWPAASPSGQHLAIVEAICSDRWLVAGELRLIETDSGDARRIDTRGVDVAYIQWRSERQLMLAGFRGLDTVVGLLDVGSGSFAEVWCGRETSTSGRSVAVSGLEEPDDCVIVGESFVQAPEIAVIRGGQYRTVKSFDLGYSDRARVIQGVERLSWRAPDGLEIQGWLLRPPGQGPHPLVMFVHGGPVANWRPTCLGRVRGVAVLMLVKRGYAVFFPNPRGSYGRGRDFARRVVGDMGGADTQDYLSGLDYLVEEGIADRERLGVTGVSYGGFMTSWLITQDSRFAAAVSVSPVTHWVTEHLVSNISRWVSLFMEDSYTVPGGRYFERSPIMQAHKVTTPTLNICGALDRCTPPMEAVQFHNALLENGVRSELVTYPQEGHGVRKFPAAIDYAARLVAWFQEHVPAMASSGIAGQPEPECGWPAPVEILNSDGASPVVLLCDHASNHIPSEYGGLGLSSAELQRHIAWDIGAAGVARRLSQILDAPAFLAAYSRLLIDLNRPLESASSIPTRSEATDIPGNTSLTGAERTRRITRVFEPYHQAVEAHLAERAVTRRRVVVVAIHSFTPTYHGIAREWHVGVMFDKSTDFARVTIERLRASEARLNVGVNEPYAVTPGRDYGILVYGDNAGNPAVQIEIRQDLVARVEDQEAWAQRLSKTLAFDIALGA